MDSLNLLATLTDPLAGRYRLERELGRGGMATVYLAEDLKHGRPVAIKVLRPELAASIGGERFLQEIKVAAILRDSHILPLYDSGSYLWHGTELLYYVMPFVDGESLRARMHREGQLPVDDALRITDEILAGLAAAHAQGIVHRDIKPENILLSGDDVLIADFGIARAVDEAGGERLTETGMAIGTPAYMSPEQGAAERDVDARSDLYSVGCVLFEMLTGEPPFIGPTAQSILVKRMTTPAPSARTMRETIPVAVDSALSRVLARVPADRFASARAFAAGLRGSPPSETMQALRATSWRARSSLIGAALVLFLIAAGITWQRRHAALASDNHRLAITNLQATDSDASMGYLRSGIPDYLVSALRGLPGLEVIPMSLTRRDSLMTSPVELGRKVGANMVLTGTLGHHRGALLINWELIQATDGRLRWSGQFEYPDSDYAGLMPALVAVIADSLRLQLSETDRRAAIERVSVDPAVLDVLLRGRLWWTRAVAGGAQTDSATLDSARVAFQRVLERSPNNAEALAGMVSYYSLSYLRGWSIPGLTPAEKLARGDSLTSLVLSLDSTIAGSWIWPGVRRLYVDDDYEGARDVFRRIIALDSGFVEAFRLQGVIRQELDGDLKGALKDYQRAVDLEPTTATLSTFGAGLMAARRYTEAATVLERSMADRPTQGAMSRLLTTYEHLGRPAEATRIRRLIDTTGASAAPFERALAANDTAAYGRARRAELRREADKLIARLTRTDITPGERLNVAELRIDALLCELGDSKKAMDLVADLYRIRPKRLRWIVTNVDLGCLRQDPRYLPMVKAAGLEKYLRN